MDQLNWNLQFNGNKVRFSRKIDEDVSIVYTTLYHYGIDPFILFDDDGKERVTEMWDIYQVYFSYTLCIIWIYLCNITIIIT